MVSFFSRIAKQLAHSLPSQNSFQGRPHGNRPRRVSMLAWLLSISLHAFLAIVFLLLSNGSSSLDNSPHVAATIEAITQPLQVAPPPRTSPFPDQPQSETVEPSSFEPIPQPASSAYNSVIASKIPAGTSFGTYTIPQAQPSAAGNHFQPACSFCGITAHGRYISFIIDCSGSMVMALDFIRSQLSQTISTLTPDQYIHIVLFAGQTPCELAPSQLQRAHQANRQAAMQFISQIKLTQVPNTAAAAQSVITAFEKSFHAKAPNGHTPDLIYFITDGQFDHQQLQQALDYLRKTKYPPPTVHVIACSNQDNQTFLQDLAGRCNGQARFISDDFLAKQSLLK